MVRYSLSPSEHEIKRGLRRIQREIKQGIFVDIPIDFENIFDNEFFVKLANAKKIGNGMMEINGHEIEINNTELDSHAYDEENVMYFISNEKVKEIIEKYSYTLAEDLRKIILSILPQSARELNRDDYIKNQFKFIS